MGFESSTRLMWELWESFNPSLGAGDWTDSDRYRLDGLRCEGGTPRTRSVPRYKGGDILPC